MPCLAGPTLPIPTLPSPFTLGTTVGTLPLDLDPRLCCKHVPLSIPGLSVPFGVPLTGSAMVPILAAIAAVQAYLDAIPPKCPGE